MRPHHSSTNDLNQTGDTSHLPVALGDKPTRLQYLATDGLRKLASLAAAKTGGSRTYRFPVTALSLDLKDMPSSSLLDMLGDRWKKMKGCSTSTYLRLRKEVRAIDVELNVRGHIPPSCRPNGVRIMGDAKTGATGDFRTRWNIIDRQINDLMWLFHWNIRENGQLTPEGLTQDIERLWRGVSFDLARATRFALSDKSASVKAAELGLQEWMQFRLSSLRSAKATEEWDEHLADSAELERFVRGLATTDRSLRGRAQDYGWMWIASIMTDGSYGAIRDTYSEMTGKWIHAHNFRGHLRRVIKLAAECLPY